MSLLVTEKHDEYGTFPLFIKNTVASELKKLKNLLIGVLV